MYMIQLCQDNLSEFIELVRNCFPEMIRWWSPVYFLAKYIKVLEESSAFNIWCVHESKKILGFVIFFFDDNTALFGRKKEFYRKICILFAALFHPGKLITKVLSDLARHKSEKSGKQEINVDEQHMLPGKSLWIDLIGIDPLHRKRGLGRFILDFCRKRAIDNQCNSIRLAVDRDNASVIRFYNNSGFKAFSANSKQYTMVQNLSDSVTSG